MPLARATNAAAPVGRLTARGVELDGEAWELIGNYAWIDAEADNAAFASDQSTLRWERSTGAPERTVRLEAYWVPTGWLLRSVCC